MGSFLKSTATTLEMIKWEHSVFALPFALTAAVLAADGWPRASVLFWIVLCMVSARSAAMAFNRWADAELDLANPRTSSRAIPAGHLDRGFVLAFVMVTSAIFLFSAAMLNHLTLVLAPAALFVVLVYSYMKRITRWSHVVLGLALGIAPSAAWIAVRGALDPRILILTSAVLFWVGGFDILYACQDFDHDRRSRLRSVPQAFGLNGAFLIARCMHFAMILLLLWLLHSFHLGAIAAAGVGLVAGLLLYEHSLVSPEDLHRINAAFFTLNGVISIVFFASVALDLFTRHA